jgi:hypothetical protein
VVGWLIICAVTVGTLGMLRLHVVVEARHGERLIRDFQKFITHPATKSAVDEFYARNKKDQHRYGVFIGPSRFWFLPYTQDGSCVEPPRRETDESIARLATGVVEKWISRLVGARCWYVLASVGDGQWENGANQLMVFTVLEPPREPFQSYQGAMLLTVFHFAAGSPRTAPRGECDISDKLRNDFHVWIAKGTEPIIEVTNSATVEERIRLTTVTAACFSRSGANCHDFREIMPFAAADMELEHREYKETVARLFAVKPQCRNLVWP